jgi:hypothetical protein
VATRNRPSFEELKKQSESFWKPKSLEEILREQGVKPLRSMVDLVIPGLADEDPEELLAILADIRRNR